MIEYGQLRQMFPYNIAIWLDGSIAVLNQEVFSWKYDADYTNQIYIGSIYSENRSYSNFRIEFNGAANAWLDTTNLSNNWCPIYISQPYDDVYIEIWYDEEAILPEENF